MKESGQICGRRTLMQRAVLGARRRSRHWLPHIDTKVPAAASPAAPRSARQPHLHQRVSSLPSPQLWSSKFSHPIPIARL